MNEQLDRYLAQKLISPGEHDAALKFGEDHRAARRWVNRRHPDDRLAATRYKQACGELDELRSVAVAVAVTGLGASTWAERVGLPHSAGLPSLQRALRILVKFYTAAEERAA